VSEGDINGGAKETQMALERNRFAVKGEPSRAAVKTTIADTSS
jgi:hypothetical protein